MQVKETFSCTTVGSGLMNIFLAPDDMKVVQVFLKYMYAIPWLVGVGV